jgi:hydroxypyruvate isomerase
VQGLSANISLMYRSLPFLERFAAAAADGFGCVEFWVAPDSDLACRAVADLRLEVSVINVAMGPDLDSAGLLSDPDKSEWWRQEFLRTLEIARRIKCPAINALAGGRTDISRRVQRATMTENLEWALTVAPAAITVLLEPLNRIDRPDYLLQTLADAKSVRAALGNPGALKILFDAYHVACEEPDVATAFLGCVDDVGHVQIADFPGRGAPGSGETDFAAFLAALAGRYDGWIGLEYASETDSLEWLSNTPGLALKATVS